MSIAPAASSAQTAPPADSTVARPAPARTARPRPDPVLELDGLVLDETQSKLGHDFYDLFFAGWQPPAGAKQFTIRIGEQPSPSLGTIVSIRLGDEIVFQTQLQPRYDALEEAAGLGVAYTFQALQLRPPPAGII